MLVQAFSWFRNYLRGCCWPGIVAFFWNCRGNTQVWSEVILPLHSTHNYLSNEPNFSALPLLCPIQDKSQEGGLRNPKIQFCALKSDRPVSVHLTNLHVGQHGEQLVHSISCAIEWVPFTFSFPLSSKRTRRKSVLLDTHFCKASPLKNFCLFRSLNSILLVIMFFLLSSNIIFVVILVVHFFLPPV